MTSDPGYDPVVDPALDAFRDDAHMLFRPVPPDVIVARARTRGHRRVALAAAAVVLAAGGGAAVATGLGLRPDNDRIIDRPTAPATTVSPAPTTATPSVAPSSAPPPSAPSTDPSTAASSAGSSRATTDPTTAPEPINVRAVDWANATLRFPSRKDDDECPVGPVTFVDGAYRTDGTTTRIFPGYSGDATFGDLNDDGRADAVVWVSCQFTEDSGDSSGQLLAVTGRSGSLVAMGYLGPVAEVIEDVKISGGRVTLTLTRRYYNGEPQERTYRWNGTRFVQTAGPTAFPEPS